MMLSTFFKSATCGLLAFSAACLANETISASNSETLADLFESQTHAAAEGFLECAQAPAKAGDRREDKTKLKFTTYNTEFLFLQGLGVLKCPGEDCKWNSLQDARNHIKQVAKNVIALNSDIIQLDEVEDCNVLKELLAEVKKLGDDTYKPYLVRGNDLQTGQNVALITRVDPAVDLQRSDKRISLPVADSKCPTRKTKSSLRRVEATGAATKSLSKCFYTYFEVEGFSKPITVVGAHLLARPTDKMRCMEREGQASIVASLANNALLDGHHVIISGDMNDWSSSTPDKNGNQPISNVLDIMRGRNFEDAASKVSQASRFTQWWDRDNDCVWEEKEVSMLDHILISKELFQSVQSVHIDNDLYEASCGGFNSDHYPVSVVLKSEV
jgi:endonuclease/exonuclease/phosphatase family metal-dependent hydrolase